MSQTSQALLYLFLILTHHCSTTFSAAIADRQAANMTTTPEPAPVHPDHPPGDLSLDPEANHQVTLDAQNNVLAAGESLSLGITNTLISPFVFVNNKISQAASSLPGIMAANGAVLGSAIATPIQLGTLAANNMAAGFTGTLVSIPISLVSGGTAQMIGVVESGRELYRGQVASLTNSIQNNMPSFIRPAAILGGANAVVGGIVLGTVSNGVQRLGQSVNLMGTSLANAGQGLSGFGNGMILWGQVDATGTAVEIITQSPLNVDPMEKAPTTTPTPTPLN